MGIHLGEKIKQRAKQLRIGPTELGKLINTSKQNIHGIYKRKSIDAELLKQLSKALDFNFFQYYSSDIAASIVREPEGDYNNSYEKTIKKLRKELKAAMEQINSLKKQLSEKEIAYLKKINEILEKKK